jgi:DUF1680 family protein
VGEIEREVYNEGLAHLAPDGSGIRYFSYLNGQKQQPGAISTCCEGQGSRCECRHGIATYTVCTQKISPPPPPPPPLPHY